MNNFPVEMVDGKKLYEKMIIPLFHKISNFLQVRMISLLCILIFSFAPISASLAQLPREIQPYGPQADENVWQSPWTIGGVVVFIVVVGLLYRWRRKLLKKRDEEK